MKRSEVPRAIRALVICALGAVVHAQSEDAESRGSGDTRVLLSASELVLRYHEVEHRDSRELLQVSAALLSRDIYVRERGGFHADPVTNMRVLGDSIVVYDVEPEVLRILAKLEELDRPLQDESPPMQTLNYVPRHLSPDTLQRSLEGVNVLSTIVQERNMLLVRGGPGELLEARHRLASVDAPPTEVRLTFYVLEAVGAEELERSDPRLPAELVSNLEGLLPQHRFRRSGFGLLLTAVGAGPERSVELGSGAVLTLRPVAFEPEGGALTVDDCRFVVQGPSGARQLFRTSAVLAGGEYTVIGASGSQAPVFVAIRVDPI